jgi:hypothetical protein
MIGAGRGFSAGIPRPYAERRLMDWAKMMKGARYHEAAHAVAAYHNGYKITGITATDDEWITNYRGSSFGGWAESWRKACVTLAGQLADQRASWGEMRPEPWAEFLAGAEAGREEWGIEDLSDHGFLLEALEVMAADPLSDGTLEESYRIVVEDTRRLVSEHWGEVEAVASALERTGALDGPEAERIIERAGANGGGS